jgi:type 1 glutamine amidotransferase
MTGQAEQAAQKTKAIVLIGNELGGAHGAPSTRAALSEFLWTLPWLDITVSGDWNVLRWEALAPYDLAIIYAGSRRHACTDEQLAGLRKFIERGGGFVPLHFTSANANPDFLALVGASFINHPPHGPFEVRVADPDHPITRGLPPTMQIEDECYRSDYPDRAALHVLQTSHHTAGIDGEPSSWVREIGRGRLFYSALGHDARSFPNPELRELLSRGIRWAAGLEPVAVQ